MRTFAPNFTQTPNVLFDDWLPKLSFVELKVLMVIMRKTFGWHKVRDQISLSQLENLTGARREAIIKATKSLEKNGLIVKTKVGKKGSENTYYELVITEDSNNSYQYDQRTPPSTMNVPTKETLTKEIKKNTKKKAPAAPPITLNAQERKFEGIRPEDLQMWQDTFPAVNVRKELERALLWALTAPRNNYRKSINTWMRNVDKEHTTPFKTQNQGISVATDSSVADEDVQENSKIAHEWEREYEKRRIPNYDVQAKANRVDFCLPNGESVSVPYNLNRKEFLKRCQSPAKRMKLLLPSFAV